MLETMYPITQDTASSSLQVTIRTSERDTYCLPYVQYNAALLCAGQTHSFLAAGGSSDVLTSRYLMKSMQEREKIRFFFVSKKKQAIPVENDK